MAKQGFTLTLSEAFDDLAMLHANIAGLTATLARIKAEYPDHPNFVTLYNYVETQRRALYGEYSRKLSHVMNSSLLREEFQDD